MLLEYVISTHRKYSTLYLNWNSLFKTTGVKDQQDATILLNTLNFKNTSINYEIERSNDKNTISLLDLKMTIVLILLINSLQLKIKKKSNEFLRRKPNNLFVKYKYQILEKEKQKRFVA